MQFHEKLTPSQLPLNCNQFSCFGIDINVLFTVSTCAVAVTKTDGSLSAPVGTTLSHKQPKNGSTSSSGTVPLPQASFQILHADLVPCTLQISLLALFSVCTSVSSFLHSSPPRSFQIFSEVSELSADALAVPSITCPLLLPSCGHPALPVPTPRPHPTEPIWRGCSLCLCSNNCWPELPSLPGSRMSAVHLSHVSLGAWLEMHSDSDQRAFPQGQKGGVALFYKSNNYLDAWNSRLFITVPWHSLWEHPENISTAQIHYEDLMWPDGENAEIVCFSPFLSALWMKGSNPQKLWQYELRDRKT